MNCGFPFRKTTIAVVASHGQEIVILKVSDQPFWESLRIILERSDLTPGGLGGEAPQDSGGGAGGGGEATPLSLDSSLVNTVNRSYSILVLVCKEKEYIGIGLSPRIGIL